MEEDILGVLEGRVERSVVPGKWKVYRTETGSVCIELKDNVYALQLL